MIDAADIAAIADAVAARLGVREATNAVLTADEAREYAKRKSLRSFHRWRTRWHVKPVGRNRYSRGHIDLALAREAGAVRVPSTLRHKSQSLT